MRISELGSLSTSANAKGAKRDRDAKVALIEREEKRRNLEVADELVNAITEMFPEYYK